MNNSHQFKMAAPNATQYDIPNLTLTWKHDSSAGDIPATVYYPKSSDGKAHPIGTFNFPFPTQPTKRLTRTPALIFHAGGFVLGTTKMIPQNQINYLVSHNFVVVTPEYRLCPQVSLYSGPIQDAKDVLHWCQSTLPGLLKTQRNLTVDGSRVIAMGHSAGGQLALTTGLCPNPPKAIIDFYGVVGMADESYTRPFAGFAQIPDQDASFINKIHEGPQVFTSLPMMIQGKPTLSDPRCAWFIQQIKNGTSLSAIVPDGDYAKVDATTQFREGWPATYFLHGKPDMFVDYKLTVKAHEELKALGVETEMVIGEEIQHVFDLMIQESDPLFAKYVVPALEWMVAHA